MKAIKLTVLLLLLPLLFYAQSLTGLWIGTLTNDSNTIRKNQSLEIVLTQYKEKVFGYSRMTFFVNDTLYYIVKRVKGTVEDDYCEVKDDEIIAHNFPQKPDKGVKLINMFRRNKIDSTWHLDGDWKTTETKKHGYYSISGRIEMKSEPDLQKSKIIPHLEELNVANNVAFIKEAKEKEAEKIAYQQKKEIQQPVVVKKKEEPVAINQPIKEKQRSATEAKKDASANSIIAAPKKEEIKTETAAAKPILDNSKKQTDLPKPQPVVEKPASTNNAMQQKAIKKEEKTVIVDKPVEHKKEISAPIASETKKTPDPIAIATPKDNKEEKKKEPEVKPVVPQAATFVAERKTAAPQTVYFKSDSLELALYDNGEIDGDTVSVLINGELVLAKQGLKASAIRKTIYVPAGQTDSLTLVLYAENLGKYPPNTGLLIIHDGDAVYQVRFSADLQQNAAVIFRRKKE